MAGNEPETHNTVLAGKSPKADDEDYPPGPITCCLRAISKKVKVRDDNTWSVSLMIAWITSAVSLLLFIVAFGTVAWGRAVSEEATGELITRDVGLWQECHSNTGCDYVNSSTNIGGAFKACQALAVLILGLLLLTNGLIVCYTFQPEKRAKSSIRTGSLFSKLFSVVLLVILLPVFSTKWSDPKYSTPDYTTSLQYSFDLAVGSFCLELVGLLFLYCETVVILDDDVKRSYNHAKIVEDPEGHANEGFVEGTGSFPGGGIAQSSRPLLESSLQDRVHGHMNAKAAFESFSQANGNVGTISRDLRTSRESLFNSKQEISRRFAGITLAEPEYITDQTQQSHLGYYNGKRYDQNKHDESFFSSASLQSQRYQEHRNDLGQIRHTAELHTGPDGRLITSVSMYDLDKNSTKNFDADTIEVWHPNERVQVYRDEKYAPQSSRSDANFHQPQPRNSGYEETYKVARIHRAQVNHTPRTQNHSDHETTEQRTPRHGRSLNPDEPPQTQSEQQSRSKFDNKRQISDSEQRYVNAKHENAPARQRTNSNPHARPSGDWDNQSTGSRGYSQANVPRRQTERQDEPRAPARRRLDQVKSQSSRDATGLAPRSRSNSVSSLHSVASGTSVRSTGSQRGTDSTYRHTHDQQGYIPLRQRSNSNPNLLGQSQAGNTLSTASASRNVKNESYAKKIQMNDGRSDSLTVDGGTRAPARRRLDQVKFQANRDAAGLAPRPRSNSVSSLHSVASGTSVRSTGSQRGTDSMYRHTHDQQGYIPPRQRSNSNPNLLGQSQASDTRSTARASSNVKNEPYAMEIHIREGRSDDGPRAPARRRRDQARTQAGREVAGLPPLSRAHSATSLYSIGSTATTIVDGCAESEI